MVAQDKLEIIVSLLRNQRLGVLATSGAGKPHTSLIAFTISDDLRRIIFATPRETRKFANLQLNPYVALLFDDRSEQDRDFMGGVALTAYGRALPVEAAESFPQRDLFLSKHPHLKDFVASPGCALIEVTVEKYSLVSRFQDVTQYIPS
jgi:heme iron utilization protein